MDNRYRKVKKTIDELLARCEKDSNILTEYIYRIKKMDNIIQNVDLGYSFQHRKIYQDAFVLLLEHFADRVEDYLSFSDITSGETRHYRTDIVTEVDVSISMFWEMVEQDSQSIWNANRIVSPVNPGFSAISYVSPKLYNYYSCMLNDLAKIFSEQNDRYAFCVNPVPGGMCQAKILFENRRQHGKVCLFDLPEKNIAAVRNNRFLLLHEFFHVLPRNLRLRKSRYEKFFRLIACCFADYLSTDQNGATRTENVYLVLLNLLFSEIAYQKINTFHAEDYFFYSKEAKKNLIIIYETTLKGLVNEYPSDMLWARIIKKKENTIPSDVWRQIKQCMMDESFPSQSIEIYKDISFALNTDEVKKLVDIALIVSRETFADIYAILTLQYSPEEYTEIIEDNCMEKLSDHIEDGHNIKLRYYFVGEAMKHMAEIYSNKIAEDPILELWKQGFDNLKSDTAVYKSYLKIMQPSNERGPIWQKLILNDDAKRLFISYLLECITGWIDLSKLKGKSFDSFYKKYIPDTSLAGSSLLREKDKDSEILLRITMR